jgi:hypothetical protein
VFHRLFGRTLELDEVAETDDFDVGLREIHGGLGLEVERAGLRVVEPLAGGIEFLEDVLHHAELRVHAHLAVVLPAAFVGDASIGIFAGDAVVIAAPAMDLHGVDVSARGIRPFRGAFLGKGIRGVALIGGGGLVRIKVRIAGHALALAVDEELVDGQACGREGLEGAISLRFPFQVELQATADDGLAFVQCLIDRRIFLRAGISGNESQRFRQVIHAIGHGHGDGLLASQPAGGITRGGEALEWRGARAGIGIIAGGCNV